MVENFLSLQSHILENSYPIKVFINHFFNRKCFFFAKSFPREQLSTKNFHQKFFSVENFLSLQNHFLNNSYPLKIFIKNVYGRKLFIIAKSFPREQLSTKSLNQKYFYRNFFIIAKSFPREQLCTKSFHQKYSCLKMFYQFKIISSRIIKH